MNSTQISFPKPAEPFRDYCYIFAGTSLIGGGAVAKTVIEKSKWINAKLEGEIAKKITAIGLSTAGASAIGGIAKLCITRTWDGTKAGLVSGGVCGLIGSIGTEVLSYVKK